MKKIRIFSLLLSLLLLLVSCASALELISSEEESETKGAVAEEEKGREPNTEEKKTEEEKVERKKVLFIGNSYTYYHEMPEMLFFPMMEEAGCPVTVEKTTKGGQYLLDSANPEDVLGVKVAAALTEKEYDLVILQEQSVCPASKPGKFYDGVRRLMEKIRANGAEALFYCTWGRKDGHSVLSKYGWTHEEMTYRLAAAYTAIGAELDVDAAFVGFAFSDVYRNHGDQVEIYNEDLSHPAYEGSFLAALTLTAKITGVDPRTLTFCGRLSQEDAAILKEAAYRAVFTPPAIPEEYHTSSVGVVYQPE